MKIISVLAVLIMSICLVYSAPINPEDHETMAINFKIIKEVNTKSDSTWQAGINRNFAGLTIAEIKRKLGFNKKEGKIRYTEAEMQTIQHYEQAKQSAVQALGLEEAAKQFKALALPANFDSREQWGKCIHPIRYVLNARNVFN